MANIAIFEPNKTPQYLTSVSEGPYVININVDKRLQQPRDSTILLNPDISTVKNVPLKYWKKVGNQIQEMTMLEKQAIDLVEKTSRITALNNYQFEGGQLAEALVNAGLITKTTLINFIKQKEGL